MPAPLPPTSAYTYRVELSTDEGVAANAISVRFSTPLPFYVDNFLDFPVGTAVPLGYYDRVKGAWIAAENGIVLEVLSTDGGVATLDVTGDGNADDATTLGVTNDELQTLATTYVPGQTLWRARIAHFTPWDLNFPYVPPPGAAPPNQPQPTWFKGIEKPETQCGSTIDCHNQVLGESIPIPGTPFALQYQSDHAVGYKAGNVVEVPISGSTLPEPLKRIDVEIRVQGRLITRSFPASPNQTYRFEWDGRDAYGRELQGMQLARLRVGYVYDGLYAQPTEIQRAFGSVSGIPIGFNMTREEFTFWQDSQALVGSVDDLPLGLGGWTLDVMKTLEPTSGIVHGGAAAQRTGDLQRSMIDLFAGGGTAFGTGDFGFARDATLKLAWAVAVAPNGVVYISDWTAGTIRRVERNGIIFTAVANAGQVNAMVVGPDEALYYAVAGRIWRRDLFGTTLYAGGGVTSVDDDGIPATNASIGGVEALAFGPDGNLYLGGSRIRRIGVDGIIYGVTGPTTASPQLSPEGRSAISTNVGSIEGLAIGTDGTIYFTTGVGNRGRVFSIPPDGTIRRFAGNGLLSGDYTGDGGPAVRAHMSSPGALAAAPDGSVYIADSGYSTLRRVLPNGIIKTVAGIALEFDGLRDGGPAAAASLFSPQRIAVGPDGAAYVTDQFYMTARRISPPDPLANTGEYRIPAADGETMDIFSSTGRHLRTINTVTGVVLRQFGYDASNRLVTITDTYGNVTRVERTAEGIPEAIVSPFGKRMTLGIDADGYLKSVENDAADSITMTYTAGQLRSMKNARGVTKVIDYDAEGRLVSERFPDDGGTTLTRQGNERDSRVTVEDGEGVKVTHSRLLDEASRDLRVDTAPAIGLQTTKVLTDDGGTTTTLPDGSILTEGVRGDPRFSTFAPLKFGSIRTPAGRVMAIQTERSVTLSNRFDPLAVQSITDTRSVNGRAWTSTFTKATGLVTKRTPAGRQKTAILNATGDIASIQVPGLAATHLTYDGRGRVTAVQTGSRTYSIFYNSRGDIDRVTDPLSRSVSFAYDGAGRVTRQTLSDVRSIDFTYDENGNLSSVAPPARPVHGFGFTSRDLVESYSPPAAPPSGTSRYSYDRDGQLSLVAWPDGSSATLRYDSAGRLTNFATPHGSYGYQYSATTGRLVGMSAPDTALRFGHDGSLVTNVDWTGVVGGSVSFAYDDAFRVSKENGSTYSYDADDLMIGAGALSLARDPQNGLLSGTTLGSITDSYSYNEFGELTRYVAAAGPTNLLTIDYGRDAIGRITSISERVGTSVRPTDVYQHDPAGRLTRVTRGGVPVAEYDYDANNNRVAHRFIGGSTTATYDQQDRLLTYDDAVYTHGANGELRSRTIGGITTSFDYDGLGNLRSVQMPGKRLDYVIDPLNRRVGKKVDGVLVKGWLYADQLRIVFELNGDSDVISRFIYGSRGNVPEYMTKHGVTYRIISDHRGSPRLVVNTDDGTTVQAIEYDEFGRVLSDSNPGFQPFGFAGGLYEAETGLVRFGARDYDPLTGRWTTKDPVGFSGGSGNLYEYVNSSPIDAIDPSGLSGMLTIYSSHSSASSARMTDSHSWIVFTPDGGVRTSYGTFGFGVQADRGLNQDWELDHWEEYADRSEYDVTSRTMWIDDAHEAALMAIIDSYRKQGADGWTGSKTCSTFARDAWRSATGEQLVVKKKGQLYPNPVTLMNSIRKINRGLDARVARRKP